MRTARKQTMICTKGKRWTLTKGSISFLIFLIFLLSSDHTLAQISSQGDCPQNLRSKLPKLIHHEAYNLKSRLDSLYPDHNISRDQMSEDLQRAYQYHADLQFEGRLLWGDALSDASTKVLHEIIDSNRLNISDINVFTIRSTELDAFGLSIGAIYVSIGLYERITTQDELAFIIAHELSHLYYGHSFTNPSFDASYAREQEQIADKKAIEWVVASGYNWENAIKLFEVLRYAHVLSEELPGSTLRFEDSTYTIPKRVLLGEVEVIDPSEEFVSSAHTHPLLSERKEMIESETLGRMLEREKGSYDSIRKLASSELCRLYVLEQDYPRALYQAILHETRYPGDDLAQIVKAYVFYGTYCLARDGKRRNVMAEGRERIGEEKRFSFLLNQMTQTDLYVIATREVWKAYGKTGDPFLHDLGSHLFEEFWTGARNPMRFNREFVSDDQLALDTFGLTKLEKIKLRRKQMTEDFYQNAFVPLFAIPSFEHKWEALSNMNTDQDLQVKNVKQKDGNPWSGELLSDRVYLEHYGEEQTFFATYRIQNINWRYEKFLRTSATKLGYHTTGFVEYAPETVTAEVYTLRVWMLDYIREIDAFGRDTGTEMHQIPFSEIFRPVNQTNRFIVVPKLRMDRRKRGLRPFFLTWSGLLVYPLPVYGIWQLSPRNFISYEMRYYDTHTHALRKTNLSESTAGGFGDIVKSKVYWSLNEGRKLK